MRLQDAENDGKVSKKVFERVLHEAKVYLTKEEISNIYKKFSDPLNEEVIDYNRLSKEMGLQTPF